MLLIATDEAGYGPKLGPMVIAATAWMIDDDGLDHETIDAQFCGLREPCQIGSLKIKVDDSKTVYQSRGGLAPLHAVVSASHHACGHDPRTLQQILPLIAADDLVSIKATPWLGQWSATEFLKTSQTAELLSRWTSTGIRLIDVQTRVITAAKFNQACANGSNTNKADLLSESTLQLAKSVFDRHADQQSEVAIFCDRHGGRQYYGGVLGHVFAGATPTVVAESKCQSTYRLVLQRKTINVSFTVKGDSFTPVALASMHAKYLRERMMESFNLYFRQLHPIGSTLVPTAGYPADANRFLIDIEPTIRREKIELSDLVRAR